MKDNGKEYELVKTDDIEGCEVCAFHVEGKCKTKNLECLNIGNWYKIWKEVPNADETNH